MADKGTIDDLHLDEKNFNRHTKAGMELLQKSILENKFGRSILVDKDGNIIAGNATVETARKLGKTKTKVVETTGDELVVVKRTDLDIDSKEARELAVYDNTTSANNLSWDAETLKEIAEKFSISHQRLEELGLPSSAIRSIHGPLDQPAVSLSIDKYIYTPHGEKPNIKECIDRTRFDEIVSRIEATEGLTDDERTVLTLCAMRWLDINLEKFAEYYCHASKPMQDCIEDNCLVIVDAGKAKEKGLMKLSESLKELLELELSEND